MFADDDNVLVQCLFVLVSPKFFHQILHSALVSPSASSSLQVTPIISKICLDLLQLLCLPFAVHSDQILTRVFQLDFSLPLLFLFLRI